MTAVVVMAKAPRPGAVKTRMCPPLTAEQAAELAEACLASTLAAVAGAAATRRVLVLDGPAGPWLPDGFELLTPRGHGLSERLAAAFEDIGEAALAIGMDTPQVTAELLDEAMDRARRTPAVDAVLGPADDGGYWAIGLRRADRRVFEAVPMSAPDTCARQRARLDKLGLAVGRAPLASGRRPRAGRPRGRRRDGPLALLRRGRAPAAVDPKATLGACPDEAPAHVTAPAPCGCSG